MSSTMERQRKIKLALACGAAFALQGCVAAAFPIVAGGLMAGEGRTGGEADIDPEVATAPMQSSPQPAAIPAPVASAPVVEQTGASLAEDAAASAAEETVEAAAEIMNAEAFEQPAETIAPTPAPTPEAVQVASELADMAEAEEAPVAAATVASSASAAERAPSLVTATVAPAAPAPMPAPAPVPVAPAPAETVAVAPPPATATDIRVVPSVSPVVPPPPSATPTPPPVPATTAAAVPAVSEAAVPRSRAEAPAAGGLVAVPSAAPATAGGTFFDPFFSYASSPEFLMQPGTGPDRASAVLIDATALRPDRMECAQGTSTVLIDLDPKGEELLPVDIGSASPALAQRLAELRRKGVAIAWISGLAADKENEIRIALFRSGLDPLGTDDVLLMRSSDERKQLRRDQLAQTSCLIAIAGDERSDFHELFDYLLNPADARALEPMIGEGWFLIPTPLLSERAR